MKVLAQAVIGWALLTPSLSAGPILQINFSGTITSGTLTDFDLNTNASQQVADLTGLPVSGWMRFDLGVAPAATVSTSGGFTTASIQTNGGPFFASEHLAFNPIAITPNFLPVPNVFDLPPIPTFPNGGTVSQSTDQQELNTTSGAPGSAQDVLGGMDYAYSVDTAQFHSGSLVSLFALINNPTQFFPIPTPGAFPGGWSIINPGGNAVFDFFQEVQDNTIADAAHHFGLSTDYQITGNVTFSSASGEFLAPEPATFPLIAFLALLWAGQSRLQRIFRVVVEHATAIGGRAIQ